MRLKSYAFLAVILVISSAGFAITQTSNSPALVMATERIDIDKIHANVDWSVLRDAPSYDLF